MNTVLIESFCAEGIGRDRFSQLIKKHTSIHDDGLRLCYESLFHEAGQESENPINTPQQIQAFKMLSAFANHVESLAFDGTKHFPNSEPRVFESIKAEALVVLEHSVNEYASRWLAENEKALLISALASENAELIKKMNAVWGTKEPAEGTSHEGNAYDPKRTALKAEVAFLRKVLDEWDHLKGEPQWKPVRHEVIRRVSSGEPSPFRLLNGRHLSQIGNDNEIAQSTFKNWLSKARKVTR